jgi:hypothetical protein
MTRVEIEKAIVTLTKRGGQGVLVAGNLILTAAHCIDFSSEHGMMNVWDHYIEEIETTAGRFKVTPVAVEPVNDIAVSGALDAQTFYDEVERFEELCERVKPVPICTDDFEVFRKFPAYIDTHKRTWVEAEAQLTWPEGVKLWIAASQQIEPGTSGGPIVNAAGELHGIVSNADIITEHAAESSGLTPRPHLALPVWVWRRITRAEQED